MRALCTLAFLLGLLTSGFAADDAKNKTQNEQRWDLPKVDLNDGFTLQYDFDDPHKSRTPDPSSQYQIDQQHERSFFGLSISKPLHD